MGLYICRTQTMLWDSSYSPATIIMLCTNTWSDIWGLTNGRQLWLVLQPEWSVQSCLFIFSLCSQETVSFWTLTCFWLFTICPLCKGPPYFVLRDSSSLDFSTMVSGVKTKLNIPSKSSLNEEASPALSLIRTDQALREFGQDLGNDLCDVHLKEILAQRSPWLP